MNSTAFKPMFMHGALVAIGLVAGTFGSHFGGENGSDQAAQKIVADREMTQQSQGNLRADRVLVTGNSESPRRTPSATDGNAIAVVEHKLGHKS